LSAATALSEEISMNYHHHPVKHAPIAPRLGLSLLHKTHRLKPQSPTGFTLIESLVAVIVIAITIVSITPPIFWATATRVQNRRAEQAVQLAQGEIDRVRNGIERRDFSLADLPPQVSGALRPNPGSPTSIADRSFLRSVDPTNCPQGANSGKPPASANVVIPVDTDGGDGCKPEFFIQVFRGDDVNLAGVPGNVPDGMVVGVRVYSIAAADSAGNTLNSPLETRIGKLRATNGLGTQRTKPLSVQYSAIVRSNTADGMTLYRQLCSQLGNQGGCFAPN
jgi:prepilin-type N-terminal cleavage/methylation domain-containing protein